MRATHTAGRDTTLTRASVCASARQSAREGDVREGDVREGDVREGGLRDTGASGTPTLRARDDLVKEDIIYASRQGARARFPATRRDSPVSDLTTRVTTT